MRAHLFGQFLDGLAIIAPSGTFFVKYGTANDKNRGTGGRRLGDRLVFDPAVHRKQRGFRHTRSEPAKFIQRGGE